MTIEGEFLYPRPERFRCQTGESIVRKFEGVTVKIEDFGLAQLSIGVAGEMAIEIHTPAKSDRKINAERTIGYEENLGAYSLELNKQQILSLRLQHQG